MGDVVTTPNPGGSAATLPGPVVEAALQPYTDNPRHAAIAVMNALRKAGLKVVRYAN